MDVFSNLMVIGECLLDTRRTQAFAGAIKDVVTPNDTVLDIGTGSGILAMLSAKAGAKKVIAMEIAPDICKFAKSNILRNHLEQKIKVKHIDAKSASFPKKVDVVTMELMDTWLVAEQQAIVINKLHHTGTITPQTRIIPNRYQCLLTLATYDFNFYGCEMPFIIQARNFGVTKRICSYLSDRFIVQDLDFHKTINLNVDTSLNIQVTTSGICNALVLEARTFLTPKRSILGTTDMNMPVIVPMASKKLTKNSKINLQLSYRMGECFQKFSAKFT
jgi:predicted RNA methylase